MSYQEQPQFEIYNEDKLIGEVILDSPKAFISPDKQIVIERKTQQFFLKNIMSFSYIARITPKNENITVTQQPGVIHPTQFRAFTLEYQPTELVDLDGVIEFEIEPL